MKFVNSAMSMITDSGTLMPTKRSGKVAYAVLSFGGFLG